MVILYFLDLRKNRAPVAIAIGDQSEYRHHWIVCCPDLDSVAVNHVVVGQWWWWRFGKLFTDGATLNS